MKLKTTLPVSLALTLALVVSISACRSDPNSERSAFLTLLNQYRQGQGLSPLKVSSALTTAAQLHSQDMADHDYFSHTSLDGRTFVDRIRQAGYTYNTWLGENIAAGYDTAQSVFDAWKSSPGHNENMLKPEFTVIGIGVAVNASSTFGWYWTTDFGGYDDSTPASNNPPLTPEAPSGPSTGFTWTTYSFSASSTDPDLDQLKYTFDWGDGSTSTTPYVPSGTTASMSHSWHSPGAYYVRVSATDDRGASSAWSQTTAVQIANSAPSTPSIPSGPTACAPNVTYVYTICASDPDGDGVRCLFDWGDGTTTTTELKASGSSFTAEHTWSHLASFLIKVRGQDSGSQWSSWSQPLQVQVKFTSSINLSIWPASLGRGETLGAWGSMNPPHASSLTLTLKTPSGTEVTVSIASNATGQFRSTFLPNVSGTWTVRASWAGDADHWGATAGPVAFQVNPAICNITVQSNVAGVEATIDGDNYTLPQSFRWAEGTRHWISVKPIHQINENSRRIFEQWDDGLNECRREILVRDPLVCVANYKTQYLVSAKAYPVFPSESDWFDVGSTITLSTNSTVMTEGSGSRLIFSGWSNGRTEPTFNLTVIEPLAVEAIWKRQYLLRASSPCGQVMGSGWYDELSEVGVGISPTVLDLANQTRRVFETWVGEGLRSYSGNQANMTVIMVGPVNESAVWRTEYYVCVQSSHGRPIGTGWYNSSSSANVSVEPIVNGTAGTRFCLAGWHVPGYVEAPSLVLKVSSPLTVEAVWRKEYFLNLTSDYGTVSGSGWYAKDANASFGLEPPAPGLITYVFEGWFGDGSYQDKYGYITMDGPKTLCARWRKDYLVAATLSGTSVVSTIILVVLGRRRNTKLTRALSLRAHGR